MSMDHLEQVSIDLDSNAFTGERAIVPSSSGVDTPLQSYSVLGTDITTGERVTIDQEQRLKGIYIIGKTGTGKTTLKVNLILQDITQGMGVCFITPHGDAITDILKRLPKDREQDVILLDPMDKTHAFGLNLLYCTDPTNNEEVSRVISFVIEVFAKLFTESGDIMKEAPNMAETLQMALPVLLANQSPPMTIAEIPLLTRDATARTKLLARVTHPAVNGFWQDYHTWSRKEQDELTSSTRKRVNDFLIDPFLFEIIGQNRKTLQFREIMDSRKILLVKLPRKPELIASLIGSVIVMQIANAAFSREDTPEDQRVLFNLYADEYQRFSTPTFAELLTEVRKYKIATGVAHQARGQLDHANKVATLNAGTLIVYQVSGDDAKELAPNFKRTPPPPEVEWVEIEVGTKPVETFLYGVVNHLLKQGYEDERVTAFVRDYLQPLSLKAEKRVSTTYYVSEQEAKEQQTKLQQALLDLNAWLYEGMRNANNLFQPVPKLVIAAVSSFSCLLYAETGCGYRYYELDKYVHTVPDSDSIYEGAKDAKQAAERLQTELAGINGMLRESVLANPPQTAQDFFARRNLIYAQSLFPRLYEDAVAKRMVFDTNHQINHELDERNRERKPNLTRSEYAQMLANCQRQAKKVIEEGYATFEKFTESLQLCQYALSQNPLMTTDSGLREPDIRKHPIITQRSYPEMESLIADKLANPPLPFAAHVKLGTQEYTIQALPFEKPDGESVWMARQDRIIEQTHKDYCKERTEVDTEIKARQDELTKRAKPIARTTTDEDEE